MPKGSGRRVRKKSWAQPRTDPERGREFHNSPLGAPAAPQGEGDVWEEAPPVGAARRGSLRGSYSLADRTVLRAVQQGRDLTAGEERTVRADMARVGFTPDERPASGALVGRTLRYRGKPDRVVASGDPLINGERHFLRHAHEDGNAQWPAGTDYYAYVRCLQEVILDPDSAILFSYRGSRGAHLAFIKRTPPEWKGRRGREWTFVEYRIEAGYWVTGFQRQWDPDTIASESDRKETRWLLRPEGM